MRNQVLHALWALSLLAALVLSTTSCTPERRTSLGSIEETKKIISLLGGDSSTLPVVLLVTDWCPACQTAERVLTQRNIPYIRGNVENNEIAKTIYQRLRQRNHGGIPQIIIGTEVIVGFNWGEIRRALLSLKESAPLQT